MSCLVDFSSAEDFAAAGFCVRCFAWLGRALARSGRASRASAASPADFAAADVWVFAACGAPRRRRDARDACAGSATCSRRPGSTLMPVDVVPAPQLAQRDAEAVGDGDQRIAPARGVEQRVQRRRSDRGHRNHQRLDTLNALALAAVGWPSASSASGTRYSRATEASVSSGRDAMVAPGVALGLGNQRDALVRTAWPCRRAGADRTAASGGVVMRSRLGFSAINSSTGAPTRSDTSRRSTE